MIVLDRVSAGYGQHPALQEISLSLLPSTVTGLVGPTASGKTTLMRVLAGMVPATSGSITVNGEALDASRRLPWCSYADDGARFGSQRLSRVASYASLRPSWQPERFARLCERFGIDLRRRAHRLSVGQRSVFSAVLTLASGAPVLLLDESQATLDVPTRYGLYEEVLDLASSGEQSIIVSTHLVGEVETVVEQVVVLDAGALVVATGADDLRSRMTSLVGPPSAIDAALAALSGMMVISRRSLGSTTAVVLEGHLDTAVLTHLSERGITTSPVPFQNAFAHLLKKVHP